MKAPVVIIGIGELAGVFAQGFLRCGYPVYPVTREMDINRECQQIPAPCLVLVTVPEHELHPVLEQLPTLWRTQVGLVQNELLPRDWRRHNLQNPTVTVVWFEKKKRQALTNILYSPIFGPNAAMISKALKVLDIPSPILDSEDTLLFELVRKATYIFTVNIAGLVRDCNVEELWNLHRSLVQEIADEVIDIEEWLTGQKLPREKLIAGMVEGIEDCPHRNCLGRRAFARLERVIGWAQEAGISVPKLSEIYQKTKED